MNYESAKARAKLLLEQLSLEEKMYQLSGQMIYSVKSDYEKAE